MSKGKNKGLWGPGRQAAGLGSAHQVRPEGWPHFAGASRPGKRFRLCLREADSDVIRSAF